MSEKDKIPQSAEQGSTKFTASQEAWRVFGIMSEFVEAAQRLAEIRPAVSIFGSARTAPESPYYQLTETIARQLSDAGFSVISGGGPGIMEAANKGASEAGGPLPSSSQWRSRLLQCQRDDADDGMYEIVVLSKMCRVWVA